MAVQYYNCMVLIRALWIRFTLWTRFLGLIFPCRSWKLLCMVAGRLSFCRKSNLLCGFGAENKYSTHVDTWHFLCYFVKSPSHSSSGRSWSNYFIPDMTSTNVALLILIHDEVLHESEKEVKTWAELDN